MIGDRLVRDKEVARAQTFQNPLIKQYALNHIKDPTII